MPVAQTEERMMSGRWVRAIPHAEASAGRFEPAEGRSERTNAPARRRAGSRCLAARYRFPQITLTGCCSLGLDERVEITPQRRD